MKLSLLVPLAMLACFYLLCSVWGGDPDPVIEAAIQKQLRLEASIPDLKLQFQKESIVVGLNHYSFQGIVFGGQQSIHIIELDPFLNTDLSLVPSKASAAVALELDRNHQGEEESILDIASKQIDARVIVNGTFHHYSTTMYSSDSFPTPFKKGDPAIYTKYRSFEFSKPFLSPFVHQFGYILQLKSGYPFLIARNHDNSSLTEFQHFLFQHKYVVGCSPMLIENEVPVKIQDTGAKPILYGIINPPMALGHLFNPNPRTMFGITKKGSIVIVTVDGHKRVNGLQSSAWIGMDFAEQVSFLMALPNDLKIKDACNLDGGGSTTLFVRRNEDKGEVLNEPSDPGRKIGNTFIVFDHSLRSKEER